MCSEGGDEVSSEKSHGIAQPVVLQIVVSTLSQTGSHHRLTRVARTTRKAAPADDLSKRSPRNAAEHGRAHEPVQRDYRISLIAQRLQKHVSEGREMKSKSAARKQQYT